MQNKMHAVAGAPQKPKRPNTEKGRYDAGELARQIADAFRDMGHLAIYQEYCRSFPEKTVRRAFAEARAVPEHRVKRSRLALFIYFTKTHAEEKK